jgi:hypothetical protein
MVLDGMLIILIQLLQEENNSNSVSLE